ncbi:MAG: hypothetical protein JSW63_01020 [Ignavibacterium sp.]|nr:MAG: hypothetical protein JSW63_01020 [Ignavibacterium sp.]
MKKIMYRILFSFLSLLILSACTTTTQSLYVQNAEVFGPINQIPIHLTDSTDTPSITFSPWFSYSAKKTISGHIDGHSLVNENEIFQVDTFYNGSAVTYRETPGANRYSFTGENFTWYVPTVTAGLNMDIALSRAFAISLGANYSSQQGKSLWGGSAGIGLFSENKGISLRLDIGLHFQSISYDVYTVADVKEEDFFGGSEEYILFYHDIDNSTHLDPYIHLTFNTAHKDWVVNMFLNLGYSLQTLLDFEPKDVDTDWFPFPFPIPINTTITRDFRGETTAGFFNVTPGIYFYVGESNRILLGARFFFETQLASVSPKTIILPMVQFDFRL